MKKRVLYFDILNILACIAVVFLHCNAQVHTYVPESYWAQSLVIEVLFYWAVPIFLMLTGANNMCYREKYTTREFLSKRMKKLIIPLMFWSLFIYALQSFVLKTNTGFSLVGYMGGVWNNSIEPIYWFFSLMISITLAMPVLSCLKECRDVLWYAVIVAFILNCFGPVVFSLIGKTWNWGVNIPVLGGSLIFVVLGYLLATQDINKKIRHAIYAIALFCLCFRYGQIFISSANLGYVDRTLFNYNSFTAIFPAVAVFLFIKNIDWNKTLVVKHSQQLATISGCSFGVFLIHKIILDYFFIGYLGLTYNRLLVRLILPVFLYLLSVAIVFIIKKIPYVKNIVP